MLNLPRPEPGHHLGRLTFDYPPEDRPWVIGELGFITVHDRGRMIGVLSDQESIHQFLATKPPHRTYRLTIYMSNGHVFQRWLVWRDWHGGAWFRVMQLRRKRRRADR